MPHVHDRRGQYALHDAAQEYASGSETSSGEPKERLLS
jgi:hypothetical protein